MSDYIPSSLTPAEAAQTPGALVLDFGAPWCGHCARAREMVDAAMGAHPDVRHLRIEDGPGRRLGRHYAVKLWPTLIFLRDGIEIARLVRPQDPGDIVDALNRLDPSTGP